MPNADDLLSPFSFVSAMGVDVLGDEAYGLGLGSAAAIETCGGARSVAIDIAASGTNDALGIIAQTGAAGESAALLVGGDGVDTWLDAAFRPDTGTNMLIASIDQGGFNTLGVADAIPSTALPYDMSIALMLHRIDLVAARTPVSIAVRTGCAL